MTENSKVFGVRTRIGARILLSLSFPIAAALCATTGIADEVRLTNGDRLTGKITGVSDGKLSVDTTLAGKVAMPLANIVGMTTDKPVTVEFAAGGYATGALGPAAAGYPPSSLVVDPVGIYYDATRPSALEWMLGGNSFIAGAGDGSLTAWLRAPIGSPLAKREGRSSRSTSTSTQSPWQSKPFW